jgi:hypothetical protein
VPLSESELLSMTKSATKGKIFMAVDPNVWPRRRPTEGQSVVPGAPTGSAKRGGGCCLCVCAGRRGEALVVV